MNTCSEVTATASREEKISAF